MSKDNPCLYTFTLIRVTKTKDKTKKDNNIIHILNLNEEVIQNATAKVSHVTVYFRVKDSSVNSCIKHYYSEL